MVSGGVSALAPAPDRLVLDGRQQLGRFAGAPQRANLLDAKLGPLPRALRRWRLKEWQAVQVSTPRLFVNVALFDAKLMQLLQAKVYDKQTGKKLIHEWKLRPGAFRIEDQLFDSTNRYQDKRGFLSFANHLSRGRIHVELDLAATDAVPEFKGSFELDTTRGALHVASLPFAGDVGMYALKGLFRTTGELTVGTERYAMTAADSVAILDDHKGFYPYVMRWDWVTSASVVGGKAVGFNLTRNQCRDPEQFNENMVWVDDQVGLLPPVTFVRERERQPDELWTIRDRDGRVDVRFRPTVPGDVRVNAVIVESRYRGPFGTFEGRLEPQGLAPISVDGWFGMGEDFHLRC